MEAPQFTLVKTNFQIAGVIHTILEEDEEQTFWPVFDRPKAPKRLFVDGVELVIEASQAIHTHSPDFGWGHPGSGPSQSALAICLHIFQNRYVAEALCRDFKLDFVQHWQPHDSPFTIDIDVTDFLIEHRLRLRQALEWENEAGALQRNYP